MQNRDSQLGRCESLCECIRLALDKCDDDEVRRLLETALTRALCLRGDAEEAEFQSDDEARGSRPPRVPDPKSGD